MLWTLTLARVPLLPPYAPVFPDFCGSESTMPICTVGPLHLCAVCSAWVSSLPCPRAPGRHSSTKAPFARENPRGHPLVPYTLFGVPTCILHYSPGDRFAPPPPPLTMSFFRAGAMLPSHASLVQFVVPRMLVLQKLAEAQHGAGAGGGAAVLPRAPEGRVTLRCHGVLAEWHPAAARSTQ